MPSMYSTMYVDDIREIKEQNPFESMMSRFDRAAQLLDLDPDLYTVLRVPNRELKVYIPTRMDSGRIQVLRVLCSITLHEDRKRRDTLCAGCQS